ncbi:hypothetical protein BDU57DRAFT_581348 [Ampelomyces quisqualis]|uniref:Uncharacterized protein n=1 Tax=Ampelomyces quisqualis TaxID=50730 RepID=A0A6A5QC84_AMPQU|nr:hypothetical protein BDU57DRAFT_581348 [Ampelomyces quisqualis]
METDSESSANHAARIVFTGTSAAHLERLNQGSMMSAISDTHREVSQNILELLAVSQDVPMPTGAKVLDHAPHIDLRIRELQRQKLGPYLPFGLGETQIAHVVLPANPYGALLRPKLRASHLRLAQIKNSRSISVYTLSLGPVMERLAPHVTPDAFLSLAQSCTQISTTTNLLHNASVERWKRLLKPYPPRFTPNTLFKQLKLVSASVTDFSSTTTSIPRSGSEMAPTTRIILEMIQQAKVLGTAHSDSAISGVGGNMLATASSTDQSGNDTHAPAICTPEQGKIAAQRPPATSEPSNPFAEASTPDFAPSSKRAREDTPEEDEECDAR